MTTSPEVVLIPRHGVAELIEQYAQGELTYVQLQQAIVAMGYSGNSLYEMVRHLRPRS